MPCNKGFSDKNLTKDNLLFAENKTLWLFSMQQKILNEKTSTDTYLWKSHVYEICDKGFSRKCSPDRHVLIFSFEKPEICEKGKK